MRSSGDLSRMLGTEKGRQFNFAPLLHPSKSQVIDLESLTA